MKLSLLLSQRRALLRQARLANLAFAYDRLGHLAQRVARARLTGDVCIRQTAPEADHFWASLTAIHGSQAVIDEHFADEDIMDLADAIAFSTGQSDLEMTFPIEELGARFVTPLHTRLQVAGIKIDCGSLPVEKSNLSGGLDSNYSDDEL